MVSCSDSVSLFEKTLGFKCDEAFLEDSALATVKKSVEKQQPYRFILVDLDDPNLMLTRFTTELNNIKQGTKIDVYACASTNSKRVNRICEEAKATLIVKPITLDKVKHLADLYKN